MSETFYCALCLEPAVKRFFCGGCKKRTYCSEKCQRVDWKPSGGGQGHKIWCQLLCGEEGVDWTVTFISEEKDNRKEPLREGSL